MTFKYECTNLEVGKVKDANVCNNAWHVLELVDLVKHEGSMWVKKKKKRKEKKRKEKKKKKKEKKIADFQILTLNFA